VTPVAGGRRGRRGAATGALLAAAVLLLASCTTIRGLIDTEEALEGAGYTEVDVGFDSANGFDRVEVTLRPPSAEGGAEAQAEEAARIMWTSFPLRFDLLRIELLGSFEGPSTTTYTYGEMTEIFGPRPAELDDKELGDDVVRTGVVIAVVLAVGGLLFLGALTLAVVFAVRAGRRRKAATLPPWPPPTPPRSGNGPGPAV
jgi:hypothetical protein